MGRLDPCSAEPLTLQKPLLQSQQICTIARNVQSKQHAYRPLSKNAHELKYDRVSRSPSVCLCLVLFVCLCLPLSVSACLCLLVPAPVCLCVSLFSVCLCLCVCVFVCLSPSTSVKGNQRGCTRGKMAGERSKDSSGPGACWGRRNLARGSPDCPGRHWGETGGGPQVRRMGETTGTIRTQSARNRAIGVGLRFVDFDL